MILIANVCSMSHLCCMTQTAQTACKIHIIVIYDEHAQQCMCSDTIQYKLCVATGLNCTHTYTLKKSEVAHVISFTRPPPSYSPPPFFLRARGRPGNEAKTTLHLLLGEYCGNFMHILIEVNHMHYTITTQSAFCCD